MGKWWQRGDASHIMDKPWLSPLVIAHLEGLLTPEMTVCEHGSGGSTIWLAGRCDSVTSFETDANWYKKIFDMNINNIMISLYDLKTWNFIIDGRFTSEENGGRFDLLLIDGEPVTDRAEWLRHAKNIVKPGGIVVLDNANRPEYAAERLSMQEDAESYVTFDGNELGTLYLVTEFYRMPK